MPKPTRAPAPSPAPAPALECRATADAMPGETRASTGGGWIGVDLDGTLATEDDGSFKGAAIIGAPIAPMVDRVKQWMADGKTVKIFTSRMHGHGMPLASGGFQDSLTPIQNWCREHLGQVLEVTNVKEFGLQELWDDRAVGVARNTGIRLAPHQARSAKAPAAGSEPPIDCRATADALAFEDGLILRAAPVSFRTLDTKARTVDAIVATETPVEVYDWSRGEIVREVLLLSGVELPPSRQVPMLDNHNRYDGCASVIGSTRDLRVEGPALVGRNHYAETPEAEKVWSLVRGGHLTDNSIGYRVRAATVIEPGQSALINGQTYTAPANQALRIATAWSLSENSNCPIGADPLAKMRAALPAGAASASEPAPSPAPAAPGTGMACHALRQPASSLPIATTTPTQGAHMPAETAPAAAPTIDTEARAQLAALRQELADANRVEAVRAECAQYGLPQDQVEKLVTDKATLDHARVACLAHLKASRVTPGAPAIVHGAGDLKREDIAAALVLRTGDRKLAEASYGSKTCERADQALRNVSLLDACRHALLLAGHAVAGLERDDLIRAGYSTGTLPYILGNAAHKFLLQGWGDAGATWRQVCRVISVADFKAQELLRMQDTGDLEEVVGEGTVPYAARTEDREQLKAKTYARNFGVSRQDIINDDLGVFTDVPRLHGRRAAARIAKLVWAHIMSNPTMNDSVAFFHATHANLNTSCALSADNLATAIKGFRNQTDTNGDPIDVSPRLLVVPPTLEEAAKQLCYSDIILPYGGTSGTTRKPTKNVWADGSLKPVIEARLEAAAYTGYATDAWYLFADPAELAAVVVGFLNGNENPTLERFDQGADRFGVVFRVSIDAGVRVAEYRATAKQTA